MKTRTARYGGYWYSRWDWGRTLRRWTDLPRSAPTEVAHFTSTEEFWVGVNGTPFCTNTGSPDEVHLAREIKKLDRYYAERFPWRQWRLWSLRCAAKRVWNARAGK